MMYWPERASTNRMIKAVWAASRQARFALSLHRALQSKAVTIWPPGVQGPRANCQQVARGDRVVALVPQWKLVRSAGGESIAPGKCGAHRGCPAEGSWLQSHGEPEAAPRPRKAKTVTDTLAHGTSWPLALAHAPA